MKFNYYAPTRVCFGTLEKEALVQEVSGYGSKALILTGQNASLVAASRIKAMLESDVATEVFSGVATNPLDTFIEGVSKKANTPDVIITVGGGSVHDAGKALSIVLTHAGVVEQYTVDGEYSVPGITNKLIPVITIPTLFWTGAEVSPASLIRIRDKKRVIFSPFLYPRTTFIDCSLAASLPVDTCVSSALDALVQGVESFVSSQAQDFSKRFSASAIERVVTALLKISESGLTEAVLEQLALASIEGLYAVGQTTVGAVHAISDPLSGIFDIHHGVAVGLLLPYVSEENYAFARDSYDYLKSIFDSIMGCSSSSFKEAVLSFYARIGFDVAKIKNQMTSAGIADHMMQCIKDSYNGDMFGNPREMDDETISRILGEISNPA